MRTIPFGKPIIGDAEKEAVWAVMASGVMAHGPKLVEFEQTFARWTGAPHAVGVGSCTAALHLCYFYLGLGPGDEVIVPAQTHVATAHAVALTGATPVFVDAEAETGNMDLQFAEAAITPQTRALSVVHFLGMPVDMDQVMAIARRHNLFVVEDCALALGSRFNGVHAGLHGDAGCFSFYPVKHITTAEGGMLVTRRPEIAAAVARQRAFGIDRHVGERTVPGMYDVVQLGFNYRMSELHAAMGVCQMARLPDFLARRQRNYELLTAGLRELPEISLLASTHGPFQSSYYCHSMILNNRLAAARLTVINELKARGIGTSIYYPNPVPLMRYYREHAEHRPGQFAVAERISHQSIALPVGPHLDDEDVAYVIQSVKEALVAAGK